jgi:hypothetical protein
LSEAKAGFSGQVALIATAHGKQAAFAPPLERVGFTVQTPEGLDTDRFGTFSGEVERQGDMLDAARAKARAAFVHSGSSADWVIASEGAFGPSRLVPLLAEAKELALAWRPADDLEVIATQAGFDTNFAHLDVTPQADLAGFLARAGFPDHALIVRTGGDVAAKAVTDRGTLDRWIAGADAPVRLETDMRAHLNPTRMGEIGQLAETLAERLATPCPSCQAPGFGRTWIEPGLPCEACGTPTDLVLRELWSCGACGHEEARPRADGRTSADPGECPVCNP